jgi:hypothetical protein
MQWPSIVINCIEEIFKSATHTDLTTLIWNDIAQKILNPYGQKNRNCWRHIWGKLLFSHWQRGDHRSRKDEKIYYVTHIALKNLKCKINIVKLYRGSSSNYFTCNPFGAPAKFCGVCRSPLVLIKILHIRWHSVFSHLISIYQKNYCWNCWKQYSWWRHAGSNHSLGRSDQNLSILSPYWPNQASSLIEFTEDQFFQVICKMPSDRNKCLHWWRHWSD